MISCRSWVYTVFIYAPIDCSMICKPCTYNAYLYLKTRTLLLRTLAPVDTLIRDPTSHPDLIPDGAGRFWVSRAFFPSALEAERENSEEVWKSKSLFLFSGRFFSAINHWHGVYCLRIDRHVIGTAIRSVRLFFVPDFIPEFTATAVVAAAVIECCFMLYKVFDIGKHETQSIRGRLQLLLF